MACWSATAFSGDSLVLKIFRFIAMRHLVSCGAISAATIKCLDVTKCYRYGFLFFYSYRFARLCVFFFSGKKNQKPRRSKNSLFSSLFFLDTRFAFLLAIAPFYGAKESSLVRISKPVSFNCCAPCVLLIYETGQLSGSNSRSIGKSDMLFLPELIFSISKKVPFRRCIERRVLSVLQNCCLKLDRLVAFFAEKKVTIPLERNTSPKKRTLAFSLWLLFLVCCRAYSFFATLLLPLTDGRSRQPSVRTVLGHMLFLPEVIFRIVKKVPIRRCIERSRNKPK